MLLLNFCPISFIFLLIECFGSKLFLKSHFNLCATSTLTDFLDCLPLLLASSWSDSWDDDWGNSLELRLDGCLVLSSESVSVTLREGDRMVSPGIMRVYIFSSIVCYILVWTSYNSILFWKVIISLCVSHGDGQLFNDRLKGLLNIFRWNLI